MLGAFTDERQRKWFSAYVCGLRDIADRDYIAARITSRVGLHQSSAWSALQAMEKYFKAILLFSDRSVKSQRSHDLSALLERVDSLPIVGFTLPQDAREFLEYLNEQGPNRYGDFAVIAEGPELLKLDRLKFGIRGATARTSFCSPETALDILANPRSVCGRFPRRLCPPRFKPSPSLWGEL